MARKPRLDLAEVPQHIVQRGNNRGPCFFDDGDHRAYLDLLREAARAAGVSVHAYALMTNHTHLLVTPREAGRVSAMMQALGRRYVQWINKRRGRTGTLFDGRFKSSLVDSERYLLCCYRYIELNPVRAGMVAQPADYPWSSYRCNALGHADNLVTAHEAVAALGATPDQRQDIYRAFVAEGVSTQEREAIRDHLLQGRALGSAGFQARVEAAAGRPAFLVARGRPRRINGSDPISGE
jgi:putative transposase